MKGNSIKDLVHSIEASAWITVIGIILLFSTAIIVTLIAPRFVDPMWTEPSSYYQVQMYEIADPHLYIGGTVPGSHELQFVYHLKEGATLLSFVESTYLRIISPPDLEKYITHIGEEKLKLTGKVLLLRNPEDKMVEAAENLRQELQAKSEKESLKIFYTILELYEPEQKETFAVAETDGLFESFTDSNFVILDSVAAYSYYRDPGVIYVKNPQEYRVKEIIRGGLKGWVYHEKGRKIQNLQELKSKPLGFRSRKELIELGEDTFAKEGCWYCHTDQTRTLVQDVVLNGSESFPAPPSSPNEYIYQKVTFPGTRRIGPDLSRVGIKRPSRDWHKSHFWSPKTESPGSIMPAFRHFFDNDPSGSSSIIGVPNMKFEAMFQYLMTKGTRITPPTQAWWLGKDPVDTLRIIESRK